MIRNTKLYERKTQIERAQRLRRLTQTEGLRQMHMLIRLGWPLRPRTPRRQPLALARLLRKKSAV